jgi:NAD+ diphosphatase
MEKHLNAPEAKFLLFKDGKPLMSIQTSGETKDKTPTGLLYLSQSSITPYLPSGTFTFAECPTPEDKDVVKQYQSARLPTSLPALVFLGIDDRTEAKEGAVPAEVDPKDPKGVPYFALDVSSAHITLSELDTEGKEEGQGQGHGAEFVEPRLAGSSLGGWEANLFAQARALMGKSPGLPKSLVLRNSKLRSTFDCHEIYRFACIQLSPH